jgi:3-isopropylmalate/(R)-2-methylmalate dehydratase small subunit
MEALRKHRGQVVPLDRPNVDTDQIIPKQFLKRIERTGYGDFLFFDWRFENDGTPRPDFILNQEPYKSGSILLARKNFGCGSSREHAAWALMNYGFRVVIAPSFADIFHSNSGKNGLLTITLPEEIVDELFRRAKGNYELTVDVENLTITDDTDLSITFTMDAFRQKCMLEGLDDIALTMAHEDAISEYERDKTQAWRKSA